MWAPAYDPHNDQFAPVLGCPWPNCNEAESAPAVGSPEIWVCRRCERPYEVVRLPASPELGGESPFIARRPSSLVCTRTGQRLTGASGLDWDQAGGGAARTGTPADAAGRIFGPPSRTTEWGLELAWTSSQWGTEEDPRDDEPVTSVSVHRGVVVAASASGRLGLFSAQTGVPLLNRSLAFPGATFDATVREHALRLPIALRAGAVVAVTERSAVFRDLTSSLFAHAPVLSAPTTTVVEALPGRQWIGPALITGGGSPRDDVVVVLVEGSPQGARAAPENVSLRLFSLEGTPRGRVEVPGLVRPPVEIASGVVAGVTNLGHLVIVDVMRGEIKSTSLPDPMLDLSPTERWHLAYSSGANGGELWLANERAGDVQVWRAPLSRVTSGALIWEERFSGAGMGALLSLAVGPVAAGRTHPASEHFVLSTERSVSAYARAMRHPAAEAVLGRAPSGPAMLTSVGMLMQDDEALWLRGLGAWSFADDNVERRVVPAIPRPRPALHDRTFALLGHDVFFATGGAISGAKLVSRPRA